MFPVQDDAHPPTEHLDTGDVLGQDHDDRPVSGIVNVRLELGETVGGQTPRLVQDGSRGVGGSAEIGARGRCLEPDKPHAVGLGHGLGGRGVRPGSHREDGQQPDGAPGGRRGAGVRPRLGSLVDGGTGAYRHASIRYCRGARLCTRFPTPSFPA